MTLTELINAYRLTHTDEGRREDARHGRWWIEQLGDLPLEQLTTLRIQQAVMQLEADGRAGSTAAFYFRFLRRVTAWAACVGHQPCDPCAGIPLPKEPTPPMRVLAEEEEKALCQALGHPYSL